MGWELREDLEEISLDIATENIKAKTRKLKAVWTFEADQDLRSWHFPDDLVEELGRSMAGELCQSMETRTAPAGHKYRSLDDEWGGM